MQQRILVIEDDLDIQELIREFLLANEYIVDVANNGEEGYLLFKNGIYNLVLLDINLPKIDGLTVCKMIRHKSSVPIILLTALEEEHDQVRGFDNGADDYITKPFSFNLLIKRVEAVLRRKEGISLATGTTIVFSELEMDLQAYTAKVSNVKIDLTKIEFKILQALLEAKGRVLTRETLLNNVWGTSTHSPETRIIDTHIKNIRKKLERNYIVTVKGIGYKVE